MVQLIDKNKSISKYFFFIGKTERMLVWAWYNSLSDKLYDDNDTREIRERIDRFLEIVYEALCKIHYDFRISTIEPSITENRQLYFDAGSPVAVGIRISEWKYIAKGYAPEYGSKISTLYELFLWYAYRIAKGYISLETVCKDSSGLGNYIDAVGSTGNVEVSGAREVGGFRDGVGNTFKYVISSEGNVLVGGMSILGGSEYTMADVGYYIVDEYDSEFFTGVITLRK
jgi:hypothetical protein